MSKNSVNVTSLRAAIAGMRSTFHTKDVADFREVRQANAALAGHRNYRAFIGRALSDNRNSLGLELISTGHAHGALWRKMVAESADIPTPSAQQSFVVPADPTRAGTGATPIDTLNVLDADTQSLVVRPGHFKIVQYMRSEKFLAIKELFDSVEEFGGVYFRPLERGVCVVDLHSTSPKPRIGVGAKSLISRSMSVEALRASIPERIAYLNQVRDRQATPSLENQLEAKVIRGAQASRLALSGFPDSLRFIHSQWRIDRPDGARGQKFTDIIAANLSRKALAIVELKASPDAMAARQVQQYARYFQLRAAQLTPLFNEIADDGPALWLLRAS